MQLWIGLGNPEPGMRHHRHNIGFAALDYMARHYHFSPWRRRFKGLWADGEIDGQRLGFLKPLTYMNLSGESVQAAAHFFKLKAQDITVFHDELDLPFLTLRVKRGGGAAGHNGLRSLDTHLGVPDYRRVRMGIGHPGYKDLVSGYVLSDFAASERDALIRCFEAMADAASELVADNDDIFASRVAAMMKEMG